MGASAALPPYVAVALQPVASIGNKAPLEMLLSWMASRDISLEAAAEDIPSWPVLRAEYMLLCERLRAAFTEDVFRRRWLGASGTVIMADVFTKPRFYMGCHRFLHLFAQCVMKTMNEAVVEGMGGMWDQAASSRRHLSFEHSVEEAVIAWSAPQPYHPEAIPFINQSLEHLFGSEWQKRFRHQDERTERQNPWTLAGGQVVQRLKRTKRQLPTGLFQ